MKAPCLGRLLSEFMGGVRVSGPISLITRTSMPKDRKSGGPVAPMTAERSLPRERLQTTRKTSPNGQRIVIETKGETPAGTNMFWLKSEVKDNEARVGVVDTNDKTLYTSTHFTGFKLPFRFRQK